MQAICTACFFILTYKKLKTFLKDREMGFECFSYIIQLICIFRHPNNGYSRKKYIQLNNIMAFWAMQKCWEPHTHFLNYFFWGGAEKIILNGRGTRDGHQKFHTIFEKCEIVCDYHTKFQGPSFNNDRVMVVYNF